MPAPSNRVRLRRRHERGGHGATTIHSILDAMPMCTVGYVFDGQPYVTPTLQWREGDRVYWHGSSASRMLRAVETAEVCLTVAILDGLVMARSAFNHSANYRSVMILGTARKVTDRDEKEARLRTFVESLYPGRWDRLRPPTPKEMRATTVMTMPINEASSKTRSGPPGDDEADCALPVWGGVIPMRMEALEPVPDSRNPAGVDPPDHVLNFRLD